MAVLIYHSWEKRHLFAASLARKYSQQKIQNNSIPSQWVPVTSYILDIGNSFVHKSSHPIKMQA
jgi:hypothetical protein